MLGATLLAVIASAITLWWKISLHMIGVGALTGAFAGLALLSPNSFTMLLILAILVSGLTGTSRLILSAHKPIEVYIGFLTGLALVLNLFLWIGN
jgi:membrane-associated phospholipid phosphatase